MHSDPTLRSWSRMFPCPLTYRTIFVGDMAIPIDGVNLYSDLRSAMNPYQLLDIHPPKLSSCHLLPEGGILPATQRWQRPTDELVEVCRTVYPPCTEQTIRTSTLPRNGCNPHIPRSIIWYLLFMKIKIKTRRRSQLTHNSRLFTGRSISQRGRL